MPSHTPGPWEAGPPATGLNPAEHQYIHARGDLIARVSAGYKPHLRFAENLEANARLIAASPELYEALKAATRALEAANIAGQALYGSDLTKACRAAIRKAEGGENA